jgi:hypothetical protein
MGPTPKSKQTPAKDKAPARELLTLPSDKRYVRRNAEGQFKESDDVGRSLTQDRHQKAKTSVKAGQGDKGNRPSKK